MQEKITIYQGVFASRIEQQSVSVMITQPEQKTVFNELVQRQVQHWVAHYEIVSGKDVLANEVMGDNSLQAISLTCDVIFRELSKRADDWLDESGVPPWIIFPRTVPISWGKEFYDDIVEYISEANRRKNAEIEARRSRS